MGRWLRRQCDRAASLIYWLLLIDLLHQLSHVGRPCDEGCLWPWGRRSSIDEQAPERR